ncbi:hypothetical protein Btru_013070 [Bulinus truncatus]|nr:hypothetical protein Btru_013070 [Bulinus truncatus]
MWANVDSIDDLSVGEQANTESLTPHITQQESSRSKHDRNGHMSVAIDVHGDPSIHNKVRVKLTTPTDVHYIDLTKVETVLHPDVKVISVLEGSNGQPKFHAEELEPDIRTLSNQFFHNIELGTVVSLRKNHDGQYHMEGHLDHVNIIAPPHSRSRHTRSPGSQGHNVYKSPDTFYLDKDAPDVWNLREKVERYKQMYSSVENNIQQHSNSKVLHFGVPAANRTSNKFWQEMKQTVGGNTLDNNGVSSDDYVELPAEFEDKKNWQVDSEGRAQKREDYKKNWHAGSEGRVQKQEGDREDDFRRKGGNRKFRRNSFEKVRRQKSDDKLEKYGLEKNRFYPDDEVNIDILPLLKSRSALNRQRRQVLTEWAAFDVPSIFNWNTTNLYRSKHDYVVEVMVMVDARAYQEFHYDWSTLQIYLLHFWQSVNSRFREIVDPSIRLKVKSINKIIFSAYQPFIENNRVESGSELVDVSGVLEDFKNYVGQHYETNPSLPDHDIALLLTGEDLCKKKQDGTWSQKSKGIAYVRGGCISSRRFVNQSFDVGVAEVGRSFRGVLTAAHEVAHLLGAFHDGESNSTSCPAASGYIMSNTWTDPYIYNRFSNCSKQNLKHFLERTWYSECLLSSDSNYTTGYNTPTQLPGQVYTLAEQCQHYIEGTPCVNYPLESQCGQLCCEKWSQPFPSKEPAADGTVCGDRKMCYNGECLHQALIPY